MKTVLRFKHRKSDMQHSCEELSVRDPMVKDVVNELIQDYLNDQHIPFCRNSRGFFFIHDNMLCLIETNDDSFGVIGSANGLKDLNQDLVRYIIGHTGTGTNITVYGQGEICNILFGGALSTFNRDVFAGRTSFDQDTLYKVFSFMLRMNELQKPEHLRRIG